MISLHLIIRQMSAYRKEDMPKERRRDQGPIFIESRSVSPVQVIAPPPNRGRGDQIARGLPNQPNQQEVNNESYQPQMIELMTEIRRMRADIELIFTKLKAIDQIKEDIGGLKSQVKILNIAGLIMLALIVFLFIKTW